MSDDKSKTNTEIIFEKLKYLQALIKEESSSRQLCKL